tara:strand:+ start:584 stop:1015 length:432 start_codon:yes stop_codon:yes gene_type:complete
MKKFRIILITALTTLSNLSAVEGITLEEYIAATLILEAGGEYDRGAMQAVYEVILNRAAKRRLTAQEVCLQRRQFSCWNSGRIDALLGKAKRHPRWHEALIIVNSAPTNYTGGADHYHADYCNPYWASSMQRTIKIGRHIFYK